MSVSGGRKKDVKQHKIKLGVLKHQGVKKHDLILSSLLNYMHAVFKTGESVTVIRRSEEHNLIY